MKKLIYLLLIVTAVIFSGCKDDFLDTSNNSEFSLETYYSTPEQIEEALGGIYNGLLLPTPFFRGEPNLISNTLSDDMLAGGGADDVWIKDVEFWRTPVLEVYLGPWTTYYKAIVRANNMIANFDRADYGDDLDKKNQHLGEAYFMRGYYYFRLAQMFGGLPLMTDEGDQEANNPRSSIDETYALIASDLKKAIDIMPKTPATALTSDRSGHATVWAAEALMARVFLFYTGYSTNMLGNAKSTLPLRDGGSISEEQVKIWLSDMIENSGHALNADPRNVWPYANASNFGYSYGSTEGLVWAGDDTSNLETIFAIQYREFVGNIWSPAGRSALSNFTVFQSIRSNGLMPFGQGWGFNTVNPQLWDAYDDTDLRKKGYIVKMGEADEGTTGYVGGKGEHETGFFNKKYSNIYYNAGEGRKSMWYYLYGGQGAPWAHFISPRDNQVLIRHADVLLMAAELGINAQANLDAVRTRANMPSVAVTPENIREERRLELCFEGLRYYDLLRWGTVESALTAVNVTVGNSNGGTETFQGTYRAETKGLLPIPESQMTLSSGTLTQNPGW